MILVISLAAVIVFRSSRPKPIEPPLASVEDPLIHEKPADVKRVLHPANPADYGMIVTNPANGSMNEEDINAMIHNKWKDIKKNFPKETLDKAREVIKEEPQKTQEKMAKIETELAKCREILQKDPFNEEAKRKQQNLLILKAIGKELGPDANQ